MSIYKLFKIHYSYLFSRINIIIIVICFILIQIINIVTWNQNLNSDYNDLQIIENVISTTFTFYELILVFFSILMVGNFCLLEKDGYKILYVYNDVSYTKFYLTKLLSIDLFLLIFLVLACILFGLISMIFLESFIFSFNYIIIFVYLYLLGIIYGHFTVITMKFLNSSLTIFISFIMFLLTDFFPDNKLISTFFPTFDIILLPTYNLKYLLNLLLITFLYFFISLIFVRGKNS